jgi:hypothetical protein
MTKGLRIKLKIDAEKVRAIYALVMTMTLAA